MERRGLPRALIKQQKRREKKKKERKGAHNEAFFIGNINNWMLVGGEFLEK